MRFFPYLSASKVSRSYDAKLASLPSKKHLWGAIWCQKCQPGQSYQPDHSACEHLHVFACIGHVGPNDGVKTTCHPDADPTSPTSYLMPSVNPTTTCLMTATDLTTCCLMISGDPTNYPICPTMRCYHFAMRLVVPIATALRHASYHMLLSHLRHASYHFAMRGWNRWIRRCGRSTGARGS